MSVKPIPAGYHTVTPYLIAKGAAQLLDFYKRAFDAVEVMRLDGPGGTLAHAEVKIGDSHVMLTDEWPDMDALGPSTRGGTSVGLCIYTPDCDAMFDRAVAAGAEVIRPVQNQFYGDRAGTVKDPAGHQWTIATHVEDVSAEEMKARMAASSKDQS
jgi:PhnB protein